MRRIRDKKLERTLLKIDSLLSQVVPGQYQLFLFGSRARGEATALSDVDLMVVLDDEAADFRNKEKIRETVYDFSVKGPYLFSVLIINKSLAEKRRGFLVFDSIEKEGILISAPQAG
jgi:predicted nucleotidyltransferase